MLWPVLATVVLVSFLVVGVFPTRSLLAQRAAIARAEHRLEVLERSNAQLHERAEALSTPEAIERLAREQYNLVFPGEEPYAILPPPEPAPAHAVPGFFERTLDRINGTSGGG